MRKITEDEARTIDGGGLLFKKVQCPICKYSKNVFILSYLTGTTPGNMSNNHNKRKNYTYGACQ